MFNFLIRSLCIIITLLTTAEPRAFSNDSPDYQNYPEWQNFIQDWIHDYRDFATNLASYSPATYGLLLSSTAVLYDHDQEIYDETRRFSRKNHIAKDGSQEKKAFEFNVLGATQSVFYPRTPLGIVWYYGDGSTLMGAIAGFSAYGYSARNYKSVHVAYQLLEAGAIIGPTVQGLKLLTGRESPAESSARGGRWRGFPGMKRYSENQAKYYAFPSGHVSGAMTTGMVIIENYMDQKWLLPVHSILIGGLMFALMDVKAHWPSDFPLAMLLGYTAAETVVKNHKKRILLADTKGASRQLLTWQGIRPVATEEKFGVESSWEF